MGWELREGLNSQPDYLSSWGRVPCCPQMPSLPSPQTMAQFRPRSHSLLMSIRSLWPDRQVEKLRQTDRHMDRELYFGL